MSITPNQNRMLHSLCALKFRSREERLEAVSEILGIEVNSFTSLEYRQAEELISFFLRGTLPNNVNWASFDKHNSKHRAILSRCHTLGWKSESNPNYVDLHRLGGWLKSIRSPVRKPLKEMNSGELSKVIAGMDSMIKKEY